MFFLIKKLQNNNYLNSTIILGLDMLVSVGSSLVALFLAGLLFPPRIVGGTVMVLWLGGSALFSMLFFLLLRTHKSIIRHSTLREQARLSASAFFKGIALLVLLWILPSVGITPQIIGTLIFDVLLTVTGLIVMRIG